MQSQRKSKKQSERKEGIGPDNLRLAETLVLVASPEAHIEFETGQVLLAVRPAGTDVTTMCAMGFRSLRREVRLCNFV